MRRIFYIFYIFNKRDFFLIIIQLFFLLSLKAFFSMNCFIWPRYFYEIIKKSAKSEWEFLNVCYIVPGIIFLSHTELITNVNFCMPQTSRLYYYKNRLLLNYSGVCCCLCSIYLELIFFSFLYACFMPLIFKIQNGNERVCDFTPH
jgi:hypothetical protein